MTTKEKEYSNKEEKKFMIISSKTETNQKSNKKCKDSLKNNENCNFIIKNVNPLEKEGFSLRKILDNNQKD